MHSAVRGYCLIINVMGSGQWSRRGTEVDCSHLVYLFRNLHYEVVVYSDQDGLSAKVSGHFRIPFVLCLGLICPILGALWIPLIRLWLREAGNVFTLKKITSNGPWNPIYFTEHLFIFEEEHM